MNLELPFDFQLIPGSKRRLETLSFQLPDRLPGAGSTVIAEASAGKLKTLLTAAFGILLARYGSQDTIPLHLSPGPGLLALQIAAACTGRDVLEQIHASWSERLLEPSAPSDAAGGRAAIHWLESGTEPEAHQAAVARALAAGIDADLALLVASNAERHATFAYDASRFKPSSVRRFAGHLAVLLTGLAADAGARVSGLPILTEEEQRWIARICDGGTRAVPAVLVHQLISQHAHSQPAAIALRFRDQSLSYATLEQRANGLAQYLLRHNIGQGSRVVVCVEPGFEIVIALLGTLKAGAVYVPLDPTYPPARLRAILADTEPSLIITQAHLKARPELASETTLVLAELQAENDTGLVPDPNLLIAPAQPAYIYYTSGTTGAPKGVVATHANLRHYVLSAIERYEISATDVVPAIARFSFSISLFELLSPLAAGGTVLLLEREHVMDPGRLARTLAETTLFHAGPSLLRSVCAFVRGQERSIADFSRVRHASSGGDMVPADLLESVKEIFSNAEVFVIYGASELSCMACTYPVTRAQPLTTTYVGRPFDNVTVRVLDASHNVLPAGVIGEIYVAGGGVVEGYLNRPELTAEKFVTIAQQRFYRTGDVGRLSEEGWLEILGRTDFQVKLRGMRIELAEVEHQLRRAPAVREALAALKESDQRQKMLVAYVVTERPEIDDAEQKARRVRAIRQHMLEQLPDYMVPAVYVELDRLPVNHNLKIDRRALPDPQEADLRAASASTFREPSTATERTLASIWQRLLNVERIGIDDNFFELGGYSLLAAQLVLEAERALGVRLDGMDILREPLGTLASLCDRRSGVSSSSREAQGGPPPGAPEPVAIFHFGEGQSLYGVLHGHAPAGTAMAVLICGPAGQERVRARFVLTKLAKQLLRRRVPTLEFDYFGCGDSLGESATAGSGRWQADIVEAHAELRRRTNGAPIVAVGVRLGALLLAEVAPRLELSRLVLWDPVYDGARYFKELDQMQSAYLRSTAELRFWSRRRAVVQPHELLGTTYSAAQFRELSASTLSASLQKQRAQVTLLQTTAAEGRAELALRAPGTAISAVKTLDLDCAWRDVARIEDLIPDLGVSNALATLVTGEQ